MHKLTHIFLLLCCLSLFCQAQQIPSFEQFKVDSVFRGKPANVDLKSCASARRFRTVLREGAVKGPNFAGHYTVVRWGCGTNCAQFAFVDCTTGSVFMDSSYTDYNGLLYKIDSRLLIVDPIDSEIVKRFDNTIPEWSAARYYKWNGKTLIFLGSSTSITDTIP